MTFKPISKHNKNSQRWLFRLSGKSRNWVICTIGLGLVSGLLLIAQARVLANIIQAAFIDQLPRDLLLPLFAAAAVLVTLRSAVNWARELTGHIAGARVRRDVRRSLIRHMFALGPAWTAQQRTGEIASAVLEQVEGLQDFSPIICRNWRCRAGFCPPRLLPPLWR